MDYLTGIIGTGKTKFVFIGEAGSGKSEIAVNFALHLAKRGQRPVHFFDLDMTKPLFRSRDCREVLEKAGIHCHYEEQFMDAPVLVGGVGEALRNKDAYVVLDAGGDDIGARSLGGFAAYLGQETAEVYYVLNAFRPWSTDIDRIDATLAKILGVSHIPVGKVRLVNNPNLGCETTVGDVLRGGRRMEEMVSPYKPVAFNCAREEMLPDLETKTTALWFPLHLYLTNEWNDMADTI